MLERTNQCPRQTVGEGAREWLELYRLYAAGFLADAGGALDQPARYVEAMRIIESAVRDATDNG